MLGATLEERQYYRRMVESQDKMGPMPISPKFITALGYGENVPKYLQWSGRLPLRPIGKRELELLIKQVCVGTLTANDSAL